MLKATNIKWDTDGNKEVFDELPTELIIPDYLSELYEKDREYALEGISDWISLEEISDWISDTIGFCHNGFKIENEITAESVENELFDFLDSKMVTGYTPEIKDMGRSDTGIVIDCVSGKQIRLTVQVD